MRYMLDTNICIYMIRRKPPKVLDRLLKLDPENVCISSITYAELMHGVEKSMKREQNHIALMLLLSRIEILDFDAAAAEAYGEIRASLERAGRTIGSMDYLIAAHARSLGCTVATNNVREFERVTGLNVENWTSC